MALPRPGARVALLVIDAVLSFLGPRPDGSLSGGTAKRSQPRYLTDCGPNSRTRLPAIRSLLDAARAADLPRVLTRGRAAQTGVLGGAIKALADPATARHVDEAPFLAELRPTDGDFVLDKARASAFFGTPLPVYLHQHQVDTLLVVGTTTSGCVRATVTDAASHGLDVHVAHDACFDRSPFAHAANLFDIQTMYGEVIDARAAHRLLATAPAPRPKE